MNRYKFKPYSTAHSSWLGLDAKGNVITSSEGTICYAELTYHFTKPIDRLFLYFGADKQNAETYRWCDWVINKSQYKDAFITKSVGEGFCQGFEVDTSKPRSLVQGAMFVLRHPFEFNGWAWTYLVDMGYTELEAYALSSYITWAGGGFKTFTGNSNHLLILKGSLYKAFSGDLYKEYEGRTFKEGSEGMLEGFGKTYWGSVGYTIHSNWRLPVGLDKIEVKSKDIFGDSFKVIKPTKKNINKILNKIKKEH